MQSRAATQSFISKMEFASSMETTVEKADEETANCDTPFNKQGLIAAPETPDKPVMKSLRVEFEDVHNWVDLYTRVMGLPELNGAKVALSVEW